MYSPTDLKKNTVIQLDGAPFKVIEYSQKVMGRGGSIVNVKVKNLLTGAVIPKTFKGQEKIEPAEVLSRRVQYLYDDGSDFFFMDPESYEQYQVPSEIIGDAKGFLKENAELDLQFFNGAIVGLTLPKNMWLAVVHTESVVKGDTTSSVMKDAELETGLTIKVPAFIKEGDVVSVDTETLAYRERQK
ncbi:MAG: elongation factor P [Candidatus Nomurabacteria bacterium]|jgi:elongation factor P|nr:elongation factor P [Candidatus Nomurabacteria bacterium]